MRIFKYACLSIVLAGCTSSPVSVLDVTGSVDNPHYGDSDPHDWKGKKPTDYAVHGIDVSKYQGDIDWVKAKASGVSFAFLKATEGGDRVDDEFNNYWRATRRYGIARGAYHFYYFCRPAIEQAAWFIKNVPKDKSALPAVLDMEWNPHSPSCKLRPSALKIRKEMRIFLNRLKNHYGKAPIIYTTVDFYQDNNLGKMRGYDFWLRSVADHPETIYPGQNWRFWQYTGTGKVPGIKGDADINVFNGSRQAWKNWVENITQ